MITVKAKSYCSGDISKIVNFKEALEDSHYVWYIFHLNRITGFGIISRRQLDSVGKLFQVPPNELAFLPKSAIHKIEEAVPATDIRSQSISLVLKFWMKLNPDRMFRDLKREEFDRLYRSIRRLRVIWDQMRARCNNPNHQVYDNYGGRGIKVCDEWSNSDNFVLWSLEQGYTYYPDRQRGDQLSIDRIDPDKDYCPENCRWIPHRENASHTRHPDFKPFIERWNRIVEKYPKAKKMFSGRTYVDYKKLFELYFNSDIEKLVQFLKDEGFCSMSIYKVRKALGTVPPQRKSERGN